MGGETLVGTSLGVRPVDRVFIDVCRAGCELGLREGKAIGPVGSPRRVDISA